MEAQCVGKCDDVARAGRLIGPEGPPTSPLNAPVAERRFCRSAQQITQRCGFSLRHLSVVAHLRVVAAECCGTFARCGCASIGDVHEIREVAKNRAARRRDCCRHLIVGCTGGIRARRLRSQPPSQCVWPMRIWRSKSKLVPENYGPSRYLRGRWSVALLQVIAFGAARGVQAANMRIPY